MRRCRDQAAGSSQVPIEQEKARKAVRREDDLISRGPPEAFRVRLHDLLRSPDGELAALVTCLAQQPIPVPNIHSTSSHARGRHVRDAWHGFRLSAPGSIATAKPGLCVALRRIRNARYTWRVAGCTCFHTQAERRIIGSRGGNTPVTRLSSERSGRTAIRLVDKAPST